MGILSKFEDKMEDGIEGAAGAFGRGGLSPVQITKKAERQMRREKIVGAGKQYAPTLYTVLVSPEDDSKLFKYYPTLAGETETYLMARARETGYVMDGHPLVRFLADPDLKKGKFDVVAEVVAANIIQQLRDDEMRRYGLPTRSQSQRRVQGRSAGAAEANMQPLQNLEEARAREDEQRNLEMQLEMQREQARLFAERQLAAQQRADMMARDAMGAAPASAAGVAGAAAMGAVGVSSESDCDAAMASFGCDSYAGAASPAADYAAADYAAGDYVTNELQVYLYDEARDTAYNLTGAVQTIGRESSNDIVVPDINISRMHAQISRDPDGVWTIADLNSTNGLFVNGRKVQVARLRDADMITLGTSTLEFQLLG